MRNLAFVLFAAAPLLGFQAPGDEPAAPPPLLSADLDKVIQARFGNLTQDDIHQGRFGASRVAAPARRRIFVPANEAEKKAIAGLKESGWTVSMYILGLSDTGAFVGPIGADAAAAPPVQERAELQKLGQKAIAERAPVQETRGSFRLEARPIPISGTSCIRCHDPSSKEGDPLGSVVYVFRSRGLE